MWRGGGASRCAGEKAVHAAYTTLIMYVVNLFKELEALMLELKQCEDQNSDYLYDMLAPSDSMIIPDLHEYTCKAIAGGPQPGGPRKPPI